jgi:hypothetical protein
MIVEFFQMESPFTKRVSSRLIGAAVIGCLASMAFAI